MVFIFNAKTRCNSPYPTAHSFEISMFQESASSQSVLSNSEAHVTNQWSWLITGTAYTMDRRGYQSNTCIGCRTVGANRRQGQHLWNQQGQIYFAYH
jgi:hypothetical protein